MAMGDTACSGTRREFLNANKKSVAKVPGHRENEQYFTKPVPMNPITGWKGAQATAST